MAPKHPRLLCRLNVMLKLTSLPRLLLLTAMAAYPALAQDDVPLRPAEAFRYAAVDTGTAIEVDWALEDGYYLYKEKLSFSTSTEAVRFADIELPTGLHHEDEFFGVQQVYRNRFFRHDSL